MKKTKLLMPLAGVAALGAVTPVVMAATSCNKNNTVTVSDLIITLDTAQVPNIYIGTTINKSQIKVDAKMSDGTTKENVSDWTCDKFDTEGNYMFTEVGDVEFTFIYEKFEKKHTFTAQSVADAQFLSDTYTLNYDNTNSISTSAKLSIVSKGTVMLLDATLFDWEEIPSTNADKILDISETTGVVTAKATGTTTVSAKFKDDTKSAAFTCTVKVSATKINFNTETDVLTIDKGLAQDGLFTVPRIVSKGTESNEIQKYTVKYIEAASTPADDITTLILPATIQGIGEGTFASCALQDIYYNGAKEDWEDVETETNWAGDLAVGVECTDGMVEFTNRCDSTVYDQVSGKTDGKYLAANKTVGREFVREQYTMRFDYSKLGLADANAAKDVTIQAYEYGFLWLSQRFVTLHSVDAVYLDGAQLTATTDYKYESNKLTILSSSLSDKSVVVVQFTAPRLHADSIHMTAAKVIEE